MKRWSHRELSVASALRTVVFVICGPVFVVVVIKWAPQWLASTQGLSQTDRLAEIGRVRTALLAVLAGGVAVVVAVYTARTFGLNRQGQITERFTRAVEQLGHEEVEVRLGGIYALERIARESPADHGPVMEILSAHVREHARLRSATGGPLAPATSSPTTDADEAAPRTVSGGPSADVQAALTVLGRRTTSNDPPTFMIDLQRTVLSRASFARGYWGRTSFAFADVGDAQLMDANLESAILIGADLNGAILMRTNLRAALLSQSDLHGAVLQGANLTNAILDGASVNGAGYDRNTVWPQGFNPAAHGATRRDPAPVSGIWHQLT
jgi:Pentapeptide repeats (8 copies)